MDSKLKKLESEIQQLKTELSIALEYYAEVREFLSELTQLTKKSTEVSYTKLGSILESSSLSQTSKSKIDSMLEKCIDLIFKDYKTQGQG
jgi:hypothetical protein